MRLRWVHDGAILLGLGLSFAVLGAEALAVFDACLGNATCFASAGGLNLDGFLGLLVLGILMAVGGGKLRSWPDFAVNPESRAFQTSLPNPSCRGRAPEPGNLPSAPVARQDRLESVGL